ncbi:MAG TPA: Fe-S protein assembly co-chaperone HscB [Burkholderiaceae bacterium]|nr:Fe-S protein assembly co-chaperone HscB [Burkholderiaceae bacterium]HQR70015.1 Fe-S protein assembly co-chaperone HscB [Burkholderiaceae bacterium]
MSHPDHFALFALPVRFAIDEAALDIAHKAVQSKIHPDRFAAGTAAERRVAMQWAARANEAYRTLKSPLARAAYLCERAGVPIDAQSNTAMPAEFLVQQLEWREALDEARHERDATQLTALETQMAAERSRLIADIAEALDRRADHASAAGLVRQLMFIEKFGEEVRNVETSLVQPREASA